ncbi:MAG: LptF/LptG family permease [Planctomycetes bacterium]|nr:LptF/LptG family permease [Planctomycetota bacterium]
MSAENPTAENDAPRPRRPLLRGVLSPWYLPTFDRWFGLAFVRMLVGCCLAVLALIVLIDNLENFDEFVEYAKKYDKTTWQMIGILAGHYAAYAPSLLCQFMIVVIPMAAAAIVVTQACLNREFTLMRTSGISLQRATMPLLALSLAFGLAYFAARDSFVPLVLRKSFIMNNQIRPANILPVNVAVRFGNEQQHVLMGHYEAHDAAAYNVSIEIRDVEEYEAGKNNFTRYWARKAYLQDYINVDDPHSAFDKQWVPDPAVGGEKQVYRNHRYTVTPWKEPVPTTIRPARLERQVLTDMVMTWSDLLRSRDDLDIRLEIARRLAEPFMAVAILMVVLPLILRQAAQGNVSYITNAIICVAVYGAFFLVNSVFSALGTDETLPPLVASQIANVSFCLLGVWLMGRVEK